MCYQANSTVAHLTNEFETMKQEVMGSVNALTVAHDTFFQEKRITP